MSMAKPVVVTSMAIEGIEGRNENVRVSDDPQLFCDHVCDYLELSQSAGQSRQWILDNLQWNESLSRLPTLFKDD